jgi:imidazolonepropionase
LIADCLIRNTSEVLTCAGPAPRTGARQADARAERNVVVAAHGGTIVFVGGEDEWRRSGSLTPDAVSIDAAGGAVVPGFVDAHTHVVFAGDRRGELRRRLAGATYAQIAAEGGGIVGTVRATRDGERSRRSPPDTRRRLDEMLRCGDDDLRGKSGYGLTTTRAQAAASDPQLGPDQPDRVVARPSWGALEIPSEYRDRRRATSSLLDRRA